ncbi:MAG: hypothetical protein ACJ746_29865 [Bryobacteraceae bacterium]
MSVHLDKMLHTNEATVGEAHGLAPHSDTVLTRESKNLQYLKIVCWILLIGAALVQAWYTRHRIYSDGVSYLEIARYYVAGNWNAALNSYWSPLFSWILAFGIVVLKPSPYWETGLLHLTQFVAYVACLVGFEHVLAGLLNTQKRIIGDTGVSEWTLRIAGYSVFLIATLVLIGLGNISPDMLGTAIGIFLAALLLNIESGTARRSTYIWFGLLLGLEYLARAAFAVFVPFYLVIAGLAIYRRTRRFSFLKPLAVSTAATVIVVSPFITALAVSKGRFTLGDAGKLNYGWEIDGAARLVHWQGEPGDIGKPVHPTHKIFDHPAVYTFASPVPGSYPPWYDPSYWYSGISPRLKLGPQLYVFRRGVKAAVYLFIRCPIIGPGFILIFFVGWRRWLSTRGILAYWFLLLPSIAYITVYTLVYLDPRYVAGSLLVIWMCILASISLRNAALRTGANRMLQLVSLVVAAVFVANNLRHDVRRTMDDVLHLRESEENVNGMIARRMKEAGLRPGDRIAWIGEAINAEWVRLDGAKIVAEVPVRYDHQEDLLFRWNMTDKTEINAFWEAPPPMKAHIFDLFRKEGVKFVMVDRVPDGIESANWQRVLPEGTPHLPWSGAQVETYNAIAFMRLGRR